MSRNLLGTRHRQSKAFSGHSWLLLVVVLAVGALAASPLHAQTFKVIHSFTGGTDGSSPTAGFVINKYGAMWGTASSGGASGAGVVYRINTAGKLTPLYSFTGGADGGTPQSSLIFKNSFLYGTASSGGANGQGVVYRVNMTTGAEKVLYSFQGGTDGSSPVGRLAMDAAGNLYGATSSGGASGNGTVFEITTKDKEIILHSFGAGEGANPVAGVTFDSAGNVYGTASAGGAYGNGTVFELTKSSGWTESTLHDFELTTDGGVPYAGLVLDGSGNLWGATTDGGDGGSSGGGTLFELSPVVGGWSFSTIYTLAGWGISGSYRDVLLDASGNVYATTHCDGANNAGTVYKLTNGTWSYDELYTFTGGTDGLYSFSNLVADSKGNLYGTTRYGGADGAGVAFKVTP